MSKIHRSRPAISAFAAVLMLTVSAPIAVHGQDQDLALAPVPAASWDETSGYGVVEAIRAEPDVYVVPGAGTTADAASGSDSVQLNRVSIVQHALQADNLGSMQEEALAAIVVPGASWDETSGYGAVEASRATIGHPAVSTTNQANRVFAAERALLSHDLGSMQEEALAAVVADPMVPAQTSDYGSLEATRAELFAQFRAIELALSSGLGEE
jgi:hypothetical protein